jgi:hypothetical protein
MLKDYRYALELMTAFALIFIGFGVGKLIVMKGDQAVR